MSHEPGRRALTPEEVRHIAALAGLEVRDDELEGLAAELESILRRFATLDQLTGQDAERAENAEAPGGAPGSSGFAAEDEASAIKQGVGLDSLRPDEPSADVLSRKPGEDAPGWDEGFFTVPRLASHDPDGDEPRTGGSREDGS